mmetsp:Transcript_10561/g.34570  ORF Transcript_10561/g.34570 Transcript_10561/m.34570 type:complete len:259 (+) Transcript_10561:153-929(+)
MLAISRLYSRPIWPAGLCRSERGSRSWRSATGASRFCRSSISLRRRPCAHRSPRLQMPTCWPWFSSPRRVARSRRATPGRPVRFCTCRGSQLAAAWSTRACTSSAPTRSSKSLTSAIRRWRRRTAPSGARSTRSRRRAAAASQSRCTSRSRTRRATNPSSAWLARSFPPRFAAAPTMRRLRSSCTVTRPTTTSTAASSRARCSWGEGWRTRSSSSSLHTAPTTSAPPFSSRTTPRQRSRPNAPTRRTRNRWQRRRPLR